MFPRATKKTREVRFFLAQLRQEKLGLEDVECYFSALLSAGRSVTWVLEKAETPLPHKRRYDAIYKAWHDALSPGDRDLFDLFQNLRDLEVHSTNAAEVVSEIEMRPWNEMRRSGEHSYYGYSHVIASYVAMGMYGRDVTVGVPKYLFQLGGAAKKRGATDLFDRVKAGGQIDILDACNRYVALLDDLLKHFVKALTPSA